MAMNLFELRIQPKSGCKTQLTVTIQRIKKTGELFGKQYEVCGFLGETAAEAKQYLEGLKGERWTVVSAVEEPAPTSTYRWYEIHKEDEDNGRSDDFIVLDCSNWARHNPGRASGLHSVSFV